jgi:tetratricopeptide (TPR) repeat protein
MKYVLMVAMLTLSVSVIAQKGKPVPTKPDPASKATKQEPPTAAEVAGVTARIMVDHYSRKYSLASRWADYDEAKDALYDLIAEYPNNDSLIFALAYFYFENQKYANVAVICNDLLARNSRSGAALELSAISYENLGIKEKSLQSYESLYLLTSNSATLYKMASLQYDLKRYGEALTNSDILLTKPGIDSLNVQYTDVKDNKEPAKEHPLKAALYNLKGLAYKAQGDTANARKSFEEAVKIDPKFEAAKQNLATLK